jgi:hypothetical protein
MYLIHQTLQEPAVSSQGPECESGLTVPGPPPPLRSCVVMQRAGPGILPPHSEAR